MVKVTALKTQDGRKMLAIGLVIGMLVAAPLGINAYANENEPEQPVTQTPVEPEETHTPVEVEEPVEVIPVDTTPVEQTPEPTDVTTEPDETNTSMQPTVADLQTAIGIAAAEHEGVEVVAAKVKKLGAETVYKVFFADGWVVYVSADDGEVLVVKDKQGHKHACHNKARASWAKKHGHWHAHDKKWRAWVNAWVRKQNWEASQNNWQWQTDEQRAQSSQQTQLQQRSNDKVKPWKHYDKKHRPQKRNADAQTQHTKQKDVSHRSHKHWQSQR